MPTKCGLIAVIAHSNASSNTIDRRQGSAQYRKALTYHLQTHVRATACPTSPEPPNGTPHRLTRCGGRFTTIAALRISGNLLCPILAYMVDSRRAPDSDRC